MWNDFDVSKYGIPLATADKAPEKKKTRHEGEGYDSMDNAGSIFGLFNLSAMGIGVSSQNEEGTPRDIGKDSSFFELLHVLSGQSAPSPGAPPPSEGRVPSFNKETSSKDPHQLLQKKNEESKLKPIQQRVPSPLLTAASRSTQQPKYFEVSEKAEEELKEFIGKRSIDGLFSEKGEDLKVPILESLWPPKQFVALTRYERQLADEATQIRESMLADEEREEIERLILRERIKGSAKAEEHLRIKCEVLRMRSQDTAGAERLSRDRAKASMAHYISKIEAHMRDSTSNHFSAFAVFSIKLTSSTTKLTAMQRFCLREHVARHSRKSVNEVCIAEIQYSREICDISQTIVVKVVVPWSRSIDAAAYLVYAEENLKLPSALWGCSSEILEPMVLLNKSPRKSNLDDIILRPVKLVDEYAHLKGNARKLVDLVPQFSYSECVNQLHELNGNFRAVLRMQLSRKASELQRVLSTALSRRSKDMHFQLVPDLEFAPHDIENAEFDLSFRFFLRDMLESGCIVDEIRRKMKYCILRRVLKFVLEMGLILEPMVTMKPCVPLDQFFSRNSNTNVDFRGSDNQWYQSSVRLTDSMTFFPRRRRWRETKAARIAKKQNFIVFPIVIHRLNSLELCSQLSSLICNGNLLPDNFGVVEILGLPLLSPIAAVGVESNESTKFHEAAKKLLQLEERSLCSEEREHAIKERIEPILRPHITFKQRRKKWRENKKEAEREKTKVANFQDEDLKFRMLLQQKIALSEVFGLGKLMQENALRLASSNIRATETEIRKLIVCDIDINAADEHGMTSLMLAAKSWRLKTGMLLIAEGARLNITDNAGRTALHHCIFNKPPAIEFASILIHQGCLSRETGRDALMSALATECYEIASLIRFFCGVCTDEDFEICRAILKKGEFSTWAMIESDPGPLLPEPGQLVIYHANEEMEPIEAIKVGKFVSHVHSSEKETQIRLQLLDDYISQKIVSKLAVKKVVHSEKSGENNDAVDKITFHRKWRKWRDTKKRRMGKQMMISFSQIIFAFSESNLHNSSRLKNARLMYTESMKSKNREWKKRANSNEDECWSELIAKCDARSSDL